MTGIPLQPTCDPDNPEEHVLWALVGMAGPTSQAPLILPLEIMRQWSKHLYDAGFRHHPDEQQIKYIPPVHGDNWIAGAAGEWVSMDTPLPPEVTAPDVSHLSNEEKRILLERLNQDLGGNNG